MFSAGGSEDGLVRQSSGVRPVRSGQRTTGVALLPLCVLDHSTQVKTLFFNILEADRCGDVRFIRMSRKTWGRDRKEILCWLLLCGGVQIAVIAPRISHLNSC